MKVGIYQLAVLAAAAIAPAVAAPAVAPADTAPALTVAAATNPPDALVPSPGVEPGTLPLELLPIGRPTGSRDELAVVEGGPVSVVPEPTTLAVFGVGLLLLFRRRSST